MLVGGRGGGGYMTVYGHTACSDKPHPLLHTLVQVPHGCTYGPGVGG